MGIALYNGLQDLLSWFSGTLYSWLSGAVENGGFGSSLATWILDQWADGVPHLANVEIWRLCIGGAILIPLGLILFKWLMSFIK